MRKYKDSIYMILILCVLAYAAKSIIYNGLSGYWYFTATEKIDDRGEKYLYVNDSVKVIYLKKDSLACYKSQMVVIQNGKVMASMFVEVIPNKYLMLDHLRCDYKKEVRANKRRMSNFLAN